MIDSKGKLFGIINPLDLLVLIAFILAAVFLYGKVLSPAKTAAKQTAVEIKFYSENSPKFAVDMVKKDVSAEDDTKGVGLGTVTDFTVGKGVIYTSDSEGNSIKSYQEDYSSCEITMNAEGQIIDGGALSINGNVYAVGQSITVRVGNTKLYGRISAIDFPKEG